MNNYVYIIITCTAYVNRNYYISYKNILRQFSSYGAESAYSLILPLNAIRNVYSAYRALYFSVFLPVSNTGFRQLEI